MGVSRGNSRVGAMKARNPDFETVARSAFSDAPFVSGLGIELVTIEPGRCDAGLDLTPNHLQHLGVVHGGVVTTLAGHAALGAAISFAESGASLVSPSFNMNLLRSAHEGRLVAEAHVISGGITLIVVEIEVHNLVADSRNLVAKASFTYVRSPWSHSK